MTEQQLREESFYLWESRRDWPSVVKYIRNAVLEEAAVISAKHEVALYSELADSAARAARTIADDIRALKDGGEG